MEDFIHEKPQPMKTVVMHVAKSFVDFMEEEL